MQQAASESALRRSGRCQFSLEKANSVRYGIPSSRAASTTARTESLPRRWPSQAGQPAPCGPAPIAVHHDRDMARQAFRIQRKVGKIIQWKRCQFATDLVRSMMRLNPPGANQTSMTSASFAASTLSNFSMNSVVNCCTLASRGTQVVVGDLLFLVQLLEHIVGVAPMVADRDPEILGDLANVPHQFLAPLLGQFRDRHADQLAVVHRRQAQIGASVGSPSRFRASQLLVIRRDHQQPRLRRGQTRQLAQAESWRRGS